MLKLIAVLESIVANNSFQLLDTPEADVRLYDITIYLWFRKLSYNIKIIKLSIHLEIIVCFNILTFGL